MHDGIRRQRGGSCPAPSSEEACAALLEALVSSPEWAVADRIMRGVAGRCCRHHLEDVVAEAQARLLKMVAAGEQFGALPGYAARVARSAALWLRRDEHASLDSEHAVAPPARTSFDELVQLPDRTVGVLRGAKQKCLVEEVRRGRSCDQIAEKLGQPVKKVRWQIVALADRLRRP